jgi:hypothetical protein
MSDLNKQMAEVGIAAGELQVLSRTDRGDVLFVTRPGGEPAMKLWGQLMEMSSSTGYWPVLVGDIEEYERRRGIGQKNPQSVDETLKFAQTISMPQWSEKKHEEILADIAAYNDDENASETTSEGEWPSGVGPSTQFITPFDILSRKPLKRLGIALVPTRVPWEVLAFLEFGGWNDCPEDAVHCAAHRYWEQEYGAVIVAATTDVVEMKVARGPRTREAAMSLAKQQYSYCADIVEQGTETISNLAASLLGGTAWYFWWD